MIREKVRDGRRRLHDAILQTTRLSGKKRKWEEVCCWGPRVAVALFGGKENLRREGWGEKRVECQALCKEGKKAGRGPASRAAFAAAGGGRAGGGVTGYQLYSELKLRSRSIGLVSRGHAETEFACTGERSRLPSTVPSSPTHGVLARLGVSGHQIKDEASRAGTADSDKVVVDLGPCRFSRLRFDVLCATHGMTARPRPVWTTVEAGGNHGHTAQQSLKEEREKKNNKGGKADSNIAMPGWSHSMHRIDVVNKKCMAPTTKFDPEPRVLSSNDLLQAYPRNCGLLYSALEGRDTYRVPLDVPIHAKRPSSPVFLLLHA